MSSVIPVNSKIPSEEFAAQCCGQMVPLNSWLSYFSVVPLDECDLQRLVYDPASAMPAKLSEITPRLHIVFVPFLEKPAGGNGGGTEGPIISFQAPAQIARMLSGHFDIDGETFIFLSVHDEDIVDAHHILYRKLAELIITRASKADVEPFHDLLRTEIRENIHGEIDERAWRLKNELLRKQKDTRRETKLLAAYRRQALEDTLSLYLHGLCCDIDIPGGPKSLAGGRIRKRLLLLKDFLPPPSGVALFPEELSATVQ